MWRKGELVSPGCRILSQSEANQALDDVRTFDLSHLYYIKNTATMAMTRHTAIDLLHGRLTGLVRQKR